ncbi:MAG: DUF4625 domain-containing protein [Bacteroidia bacterium]
MKNTTFLLLALLMLSLGTACKKDNNNDDDKKDDPQVDTEKPTLNLVQPIEGATFENGDTMHIHAVITDNETVHDVAVAITRTNDDSEIFHAHYHFDAASAEVDTFYIISVPIHSDLILRVEASDHSENDTAISRGYHIMM